MIACALCTKPIRRFGSDLRAACQGLHSRFAAKRLCCHTKLHTKLLFNVGGTLEVAMESSLYMVSQDQLHPISAIVN